LADDSFVPPSNVLFGGDSTFEPMEWLDGDVPRGFNVDIAQAVARTGGTKTTYHLGAWPDILRGLQEGSIDAVAMYRSPEREKSLLLTDNYYYVYHAIFAKPDRSTLTSPARLGGLRVAVEEGAYAHDQILSKVPNAIIVAKPNTQTAMKSVLDGEADCAIITSLAAERLIQRQRYPLQQHGAPFWPASYTFAVRKDRPELAAWLNASLVNANSSGELSEIFQKWKPELVPRAQSEMMMRLMTSAIGVLVASLLLGSFWYWSMRRQVTARTSELRASLRAKDEAQAELKRLANIDPTTGLSRPNRFVIQVDERLADLATTDKMDAELLVVRLIDLSDVVRSFGFERASEIVQSFAQIVLSRNPLASAYLGRGVFAMLLNGHSGTHTVRELMAQLKSVHREIPARLTAGSARWNNSAEDANQLLRHAEIALAMSTQSKSIWRLYDSGMEPSVRDMDIVSAFVEGDIQGLYPVFQPRVNLATGASDGAEALARWNHPKYGEISPSVFVPLLERSGMIAKLTETMVDHALRVASKLAKLGIERKISVNIAAHDLMESDLVDLVDRAIEKYGVRGDLLRLELTETSMAGDPDRARQTLEQLQRSGVSVSLDDFGTGYSSLLYLSLFPIREIKIDKSFATDMLRNPRHRSIVRSTLAMANELGMATVAEGIEDRATLEGLLADGCNAGQGFHICRPLIESDFIRWMMSESRDVTKSISIPQ
jgi:predicted signal transduction protein with EAL and GGDEF domain/ABC-type amino acid transport substrate-binding protein